MVIFYTYLELYLDDLRKKLSLSEFENYFNTPHQTIKAHLSNLVKSKIVLEEKKARFRFYYLNLKNSLVIEYLALCEKERLIEFLNKNTLFNRLYQSITSYLKENSVLLFGSAVKNREYSDIDLLIISKDKKIREELKKIESTYSVKIHVVQTSENELTEALLLEIKKKHIILNNHDYFVRVIYKNELGMV